MKCARDRETNSAARTEVVDSLIRHRMVCPVLDVIINQPTSHLLFSEEDHHAASGALLYLSTYTTGASMSDLREGRASMTRRPSAASTASTLTADIVIVRPLDLSKRVFMSWIGNCPHMVLTILSKDPVKVKRRDTLLRRRSQAATYTPHRQSVVSHASIGSNSLPSTLFGDYAHPVVTTHEGEDSHPTICIHQSDITSLTHSQPGGRLRRMTQVRPIQSSTATPSEATHSPDPHTTKHTRRCKMMSCHCSQR